MKLEDEDLDKIRKFYIGLFDFFFDPSQKDENHEAVLCLIENSQMNKRLGRSLIPQDMMDSLCSSGFNYKDYANIIREAIDVWEVKCDTREGALIDGFDED